MVKSGYKIIGIDPDDLGTKIVDENVPNFLKRLPTILKKIKRADTGEDRFGHSAHLKQLDDEFNFYVLGKLVEDIGIPIDGSLDIDSKLSMNYRKNRKEYGYPLAGRVFGAKPDENEAAYGILLEKRDFSGSKTYPHLKISFNPQKADEIKIVATLDIESNVQQVISDMLLLSHTDLEKVRLNKENFYDVFVRDVLYDSISRRFFSNLHIAPFTKIQEVLNEANTLYSQVGAERLSYLASIRPNYAYKVLSDWFPRGEIKQDSNRKISSSVAELEYERILLDSMGRQIKIY